MSTAMMSAMPCDSTRAASGAIGLFGLGNVLMGDDALGPTVIAHVRSELEVSDDVRIEDLGTPGLDLYSELAPLSAVIIVDTVRARGRPGTIGVFRKADILRRSPEPRTSPHDPGLKETLLKLELARTGPTDITLIGVVPRLVDYRIELTPEVAGAVPSCVEAVRVELARLGAPPAEGNRKGAVLWWRSGRTEVPR